MKNELAGVRSLVKVALLVTGAVIAAGVACTEYKGSSADGSADRPGTGGSTLGGTGGAAMPGTGGTVVGTGGTPAGTGGVPGDTGGSVGATGGAGGATGGGPGIGGGATGGAAGGRAGIGGRGTGGGAATGGAGGRGTVGAGTGGAGTGGAGTGGAGGRGTGGAGTGGAGTGGAGTGGAGTGGAATGGAATGGAGTGGGGTGGMMCSTGAHPCGNVCKGDTDPSFCGASCLACSGGTPDCVGGACGCLRTTCGGACVDTMTDADHCGRCSHSCTGGTCSAGKCQAVVIATNQFDTLNIALDATYVYFTVSDVFNGPWFVRRAPLAGNSQRTAETLVSGLDNVNGLAVNATHIYVTNLGNTQNVVRAPIGGGTATLFADSEAGPSYIRLQGTNAYWVRGSDPTGQVMRQALTGASGSATSISGPYSNPAALWVDATNAYFALSAGTVSRVPLAGGTTTPLSTNNQGQMYPRDITANATHVFWANNGLPSGIMRVPMAGGTATSLYSSATNPINSIAIDEIYVYFGMAGQLLRIPLGGGTPEPMSTNQGTPWQMVVTATHVYWTTRTQSTTGAVVRIAK